MIGDTMKEGVQKQARLLMTVSGHSRRFADVGSEGEGLADWDRQQRGVPDRQGVSDLFDMTFVIFNHCHWMTDYLQNKVTVCRSHVRLTPRVWTRQLIHNLNVVQCGTIRR